MIQFEIDQLAIKIRIDDFVEVVFIQSSMVISQLAFWFDSTVVDRFAVDGTGAVQLLLAKLSGRADDSLVDGAVQGAAQVCQGGGALLARAQSGRVRNYMFGAVATAAIGVLIVLYASRS
jgi:hypothetical protein